MGNCLGGSETTVTGLKDDDSERPKLSHAPSIKGPMTKYMLRFDKVKEVYALVEKGFSSTITGQRNSKSKFHNKVPVSAIPTILDSLGVPKFDNLDQIITTHFKSAGKQNIDFKQFLIGVGNLVWKQGVKRVAVVADTKDYGAKLMITGTIEKIDPGSPADKAGLKVGDKVEEINGHAVKNGGTQYKISLENALNVDSLDKTKTARIVFQRDLAAELGAKSSNPQGWTDLKEGFATVEAMFEDIDADKGGSIDFEEFMNAFNQCSGTMDEDRVKMRLKELDFDGNNEIDRDEFIFGISAWVGFADDEDLDDDRA